MLLIRGENVVAVGEIVGSSERLPFAADRQDLIAEDMVPLRENSLEEIQRRIAEDNVGSIHITSYLRLLCAGRWLTH